MVDQEKNPLVPPEVVSQLGKRKSVRIALIREHDTDPKVLLTTEHKGIIYHSLPGGKVDPSEYNGDTSIDEAFATALARELEEELGLSKVSFYENVRNVVTYFDFAILTKFNQEDPLSEVVFYALLPNDALERLNLGGQEDKKIINYDWFLLSEVIKNYRVEDQTQIPPEGIFIFVDSHIPGILERLSEKLSGKESES